MSLAMMALVRTGDPTHYDSMKRKELRADASRAVTELGWGGLFLAPPPEAPAANLVKAMHMFRAAVGNGASLYVPPEADAFWNLTADCDGKSLLPMAVAGIPMLNGYFPEQAECRQEFALSGYASVPDQVSKLDSAGICKRSRENGGAMVMTAPSLSTTGYTLCPAY
jgi:hypothetical protein